jgi:nucleotide-binding universal stress UspA family protein
MRYPYKRILCPVDFDDNSMAALAHARRLAIDMGATIFLVHVLPILPLLSDHGIAGGDIEGPEQEARRLLTDIASRQLSRIKVEIHTHISFVSEVPKSILASARELAADLIVMATHGRTGIKHLFFGSVTEAVVRNALCPVLTLRFGAEPQPESEADESNEEANPVKAAKPAEASKSAKPAASSKKTPGAAR